MHGGKFEKRYYQRLVKEYLLPLDLIFRCLLPTQRRLGAFKMLLLHIGIGHKFFESFATFMALTVRPYKIV